MRMKSKFFPLGTWFHSLMRAETQWTVRKKIFINFAMHTIFAHFFKKFVCSNLLEWLQWWHWLAASSKPWSHICGIFSLLPMHSVNLFMGKTVQRNKLADDVFDFSTYFSNALSGVYTGNIDWKTQISIWDSKTKCQEGWFKEILEGNSSVGTYGQQLTCYISG